MNYRLGNPDDASSSPILEGIFNTEPGKRFEEQVNQVLEFITKGHVLTTLPAIAKSAKRRVDALATEYPALKPLLRRVNESNMIEAMEELPAEEDRPWYFSFGIMAIYAYLESYIKQMTRLVSGNDDLRSRINEYLLADAENRPDKTRPAILEVEQMSRFGVRSRLNTIDGALDISPLLAKIIGESEINILRNGTLRFIDIRGKVAHSNPKLDHEDYTFDALEADLDDFVVDLSEMEGFLDKIGFSQYGISEIKDAVNQVAEDFKKIRLLLLTAIVYPALIDAVVHVLLSK